MFFSKKKKRKRFLCLRILCFFGIKGDYSVPQTVMSNYLNTTICFDLYDWHAQKIQKLSNSTPRTNGHRPKGKVKGVLGNFNRTGRKHLKMFSVYNEFVLFLMNKSMF